MTMELDTFQQRWLAQDARLNEELNMNKRLLLRAERQGARSSMRWLRRGAALNILFGALCLLGSGLFIGNHLDELRFAVPAVALHLWLAGAVVASVAQFVRAGAIDYDAPVVEIQRRLEALRVLMVRSLRMLFLFGLPIWYVPFLIVAMQAWFGVDLYGIFGGAVLLTNMGASVALALAAFWACRRYAMLLDSSPFARQLVRGLAGYSLAAAQDQLAKIAAFERGDA